MESQSSPRWHFAGALAAWLIPGLGHWLLGQRQRGLILLLCIGLLWTGGFLIGGVSVFDRKEHPVWFAGQMLIAPSFLAEAWHRSLQGPDGQPARPDAAVIPYTPSYGHVHEQGVLYTALAGMLNLLAIMDVLYQDPAARKRQQAAPSDAPAGPDTSTSPPAEGGQAT